MWDKITPYLIAFVIFVFIAITAIILTIVFDILVSFVGSIPVMTAIIIANIIIIRLVIYDLERRKEK